MAAAAPARPSGLVVMLVVRHGRAGKRGQGGDDSCRRLDGRGRRRALALAALLAGFQVDRILSSPYERCLETVGPLASARP